MSVKHHTVTTCDRCGTAESVPSGETKKQVWWKYGYKVRSSECSVPYDVGGDLCDICAPRVGIAFEKAVKP